MQRWRLPWPRRAPSLMPRSGRVWSEDARTPPDTRERIKGNVGRQCGTVVTAIGSGIRPGSQQPPPLDIEHEL